MSDKPSSIADFYRIAATDIGSGALVKWIFFRAKALGRQRIAESALKRAEDRQLTVEARAASLHTDAAQALILQHSVHPAEFQRAEQELAEATEIVAAAEEVIATLRKKEAP